MCLKQNPKIKRWKEETIRKQKWKGPQEWECVLSTIRTSIFSNQNCQLSVNEDGDLEITFLDGDELGIIDNMAQVMEKRKKMGINKVSWWGNRAVRIKVKNQYKFLKTDLKSPR